MSVILDDLNTLIEPKEFIDNVLEIYIRKAITIIKQYINNDSYDNAYIEANFPDAIVELVYNSYKGKGKENIQSETQGTRSITYKSLDITKSVKALLPTPSIKMR